MSIRRSKFSSALAALILAALLPATAMAARISLIWSETGTSQLMLPADEGMSRQALLIVLDPGEAGVSALNLTLVFDDDGEDGELVFEFGTEQSRSGIVPFTFGTHLIPPGDPGEGLVGGIGGSFPDPIFEPVTLGSVVFKINHEALAMDGVDIWPWIAPEVGWDNFISDAEGRDLGATTELFGAEVKPLPEPTTAMLVLAGLGLCIAGARRTHR